MPTAPPSRPGRPWPRRSAERHRTRASTLRSVRGVHPGENHGRVHPAASPQWVAWSRRSGRGAGTAWVDDHETCCRSVVGTCCRSVVIVVPLWEEAGEWPCRGSPYSVQGGMRRESDQASPPVRPRPGPRRGHVRGRRHRRPPAAGHLRPDGQAHPLGLRDAPPPRDAPRDRRPHPVRPGVCRGGFGSPNPEQRGR